MMTNHGCDDTDNFEEMDSAKEWKAKGRFVRELHGTTGKRSLRRMMISNAPASGSHLA